MAREQTITSVTVLNALRAGPLREPAHVWLFEVRNGTGYRRQPRYADALVVSVWPSRGIWLAGIEVKVDRKDWLRELDDPKKSAELQRFCDYWWVASPADIVRDNEVPNNWGHYALDGKKVRAKKNAPKLKPQPYDAEFVASVLRNQSEVVGRIRQEGHQEGWEAAAKRYDSDAHDKQFQEFDECRRERDQLKRELDFCKRDLTGLKQTIAEFERGAGIEHTGLAGYRGGNYGSQQLGEQFKAARLLAQNSPAVLAERFQEVANALMRLAELTAQEKDTGT